MWPSGNGTALWMGRKSCILSGVDAEAKAALSSLLKNKYIQNIDFKAAGAAGIRQKLRAVFLNVQTYFSTGLLNIRLYKRRHFAAAELIIVANCDPYFASPLIHTMSE